MLQDGEGNDFEVLASEQNVEIDPEWVNGVASKIDANVLVSGYSAPQD